MSKKKTSQVNYIFITFFFSSFVSSVYIILIIPVIAESERGNGVFIFPNGAKYEGEWQMIEGIVKRHGKGVFTEGDAVYTGTFSSSLSFPKRK